MRGLYFVTAGDARPRIPLREVAHIDEDGQNARGHQGRREPLQIPRLQPDPVQGRSLRSVRGPRRPRGILYVPQVGIISPSSMGILPSVEMAIWVAVGGRGTLVGAIVGALVVNFAKTYLSETFPSMWLYFQGALFVGVVLLFPQGIVGLVAKLSGKKKAPRWPARRPAKRQKAPGERIGMAKTIVQTEGVSVDFSGFKALDGVNFSMEAGELRFLIGPNGAGKTTLLDVICGKVKPTEGSLLFGGDIDLDGQWAITR